jgi:hypothetical protein
MNLEREAARFDSRDRDPLTYCSVFQETFSFFVAASRDMMQSSEYLVPQDRKSALKQARNSDVSLPHKSDQRAKAEADPLPRSGWRMLFVQEHSSSPDLMIAVKRPVVLHASMVFLLALEIDFSAPSFADPRIRQPKIT